MHFENAFFVSQVAIDNALKALESSIADAERLLTPMPFTYVVHVRTFLLIYLLGLPFILVSDLDWVMLVAVVFVGYLMFGLEQGCKIRSGRDRIIRIIAIGIW